MTSLAHPVHRVYMLLWEDMYASAVFSGITGDADHLKRNSYHNGIEDNPIRFGFSNQRPDDRVPPGTWPTNLSAAGDMSMSKADMVKDYKRMMAVYKDPTDPRRKYLNAFNGWNGVGDAKRVDFVANTITWASPDHKWHVHEEFKRKWIGKKEAHDAILSIHRGWTKAQWIASIQPPAPQPQPPVIMPTPVEEPMFKYVIFTDSANKRWLATDGVDGPSRRELPVATPDDEAFVLKTHFGAVVVSGTVVNPDAFGPVREVPVPPVPPTE